MVKIPEGQKVDSPVDLSELERKASAGDTNAQIALALFFEVGVGKEKDSDAALKWWRQAADSGNAWAQVTASQILASQADGDPAQKQAAEELANKAKLQGFVTNDKRVERLTAIRPKILIVDDSSAVREMLRTSLEKIGADVIEAEDGRLGVEVLLKNPDVKLLFADINMPNKDGLSMIEDIRTHSAFAALPVIMLTTESSKDMVMRAKKSNVRAWLIKPFNDAAIATVVSRLLDV